jgi:exodeoxyribonuclease VII large subunit
VRGEIGRLSRPRSGHVYLDLKDDRSVLASVIWKGVAARLAHAPEEGMEVVATGRLTTFPGQSKYQLVIEDLVPAGAGALMAMLERRRAALAAEGLFDEGRKRPLPFLPEVIGVVTSPSGAVIRDILHRLRDRFPRHVLIWPVAVQGAACAPEVARAIRGFNALPEGGAIPRPDVLIVARGGGSLEDLWGFNEEAVVRAAAESVIPLISAVGHETDTTLIDYASDRRAPTPTAAAEMAVPVRLDLLNWVRQQDGYMTRAARQGVARGGSGWATWRAACRGPRRCSMRRASGWTGRCCSWGPRCGRRHRCGGGSWTSCLARLEPALERAVAKRRLELGRVAAQLRPSDTAQSGGGERDVWRSFARRATGPWRWAGAAARQAVLAGAAARDAGLRGDAAAGLRGGPCRRACGDQCGRGRGRGAAGDRVRRWRLAVDATEGAARPAPKRKPRRKPPDQGSLF